MTLPVSCGGSQRRRSSVNASWSTRWAGVMAAVALQIVGMTVADPARALSAWAATPGGANLLDERNDTRESGRWMQGGAHLAALRLVQQREASEPRLELG